VELTVWIEYKKINTFIFIYIYIAGSFLFNISITYLKWKTSDQRSLDSENLIFGTNVYIFCDSFFKNKKIPREIMKPSPKLSKCIVKGSKVRC